MCRRRGRPARRARDARAASRRRFPTISGSVTIVRASCADRATRTGPGRPSAPRRPREADRRPHVGLTGQPSTRARDRRLPAAGLADERERLARPRRTHAVDRVHHSLRPGARKCFDHAVDLEQIAHVTPRSRMQAARWSGASARSAWYRRPGIGPGPARSADGTRILPERRARSAAHRDRRERAAALRDRGYRAPADRACTGAAATRTRRRRCPPRPPARRT